jgi:hypothetical protein
MNAIHKKSGQYMGTRIDHKWWRRYSKGGFFTRGIGEYWIKDGFLFFQQHTRQKPIHLPLNNLAQIKVCPCKGKTGGLPVIKLVWEKEGHWLSSSFVLSGIMEKSDNLLASLRTGV